MSTLNGISIVIPTAKNLFFLKRVLNSLSQQSFKGPLEVFVCATHLSSEERNSILSLAAQLPLKILSIPVASISAARNQGLLASQLSLVFFMDDDCYFPHSHYLSDLFSFHGKHPATSGGGFYLSKETAQYSDTLYNFMCNAWLKSHQLKNQQAGVLLGGCAFYPLSILRQFDLKFTESKPHAGEEYFLHQQLLHLQQEIILDERWSLYHAPHTALKKVISKSWQQGKVLERGKIIPRYKQFKNVAQFLYSQPRTTKHLPMLLTYALVGRSAHVFSRLSVKDLITPSTSPSHMQNELQS